MIKTPLKSLKYLIIASLLIIFSKISIAEEFGTKEEALELLDRTVNLVKDDRNRALDLFTNGSGGLHVKDLYPFCTVSYTHLTLPTTPYV